MKQAITRQQLEELSTKGKDALLGYRTKFDFDYFDIVNIEEGDNRWFLPLMTIGQMIEFLDEHYKREPYDYIDDSDYDRVLGINEENARFDLGWRGKLCDALWEAVKQALEQ